MRIVVLDGFAADQGDGKAAWSELAALGDLTVRPRTSPRELADACAGAEALITNKVVLDRAMLGALPLLRYVGVSATGTNIVDLDAARAAGIAVTNVPGYSTESVAQHVFALLLQLTSDAAGHAAAVRDGAWARSPDFCFFTQPLVELAGRTLVVLGLGAIGAATARIARGFGMEVLAAAVPGSTPRGQSERLPLAAALSRADVVTLHCPLTPATTAFVNRDFLRLLKPGALLINTSRGGLIDEPALIEALAEGRLGGVGLDVLGAEPPPADHPLTKPDAPWARRVVLTPHVAWGTVAARARLRRAVATNLAAFVRGERMNRVA